MSQGNPNGYALSRRFFDFCFENPERIKPNHIALYFFAIEQCNRLGWKKKFGLPTDMVKEAIGIRSYNTYKNTLNDLVSWGFIEMIERSRNQYSSNVIALSNFNKALDRALDKAIMTQALERDKSIVSIDKPETNKPKTNGRFTPPSLDEIKTCFIEKTGKEEIAVREAQKFINHYNSNGWKVGKNKMVNWKSAVSGWINRMSEYSRTDEKGAPKLPNFYDKEFERRHNDNMPLLQEYWQHLRGLGFQNIQLPGSTVRTWKSPEELEILNQI